MDKQSKRDGYEMRVARKAKKAQSGSGRGTIGPDKDRDSSKYAQTMAERHGISKGQKTQKTQIDEDDDRLVLVQAAEGRVYDGAEDLVVTSEERQKNVMHYRKKGSEEALVGHANKPEHGLQAFETAQALFHTKDLLFAVKPHRPDRLAQAKANRVAYDVVMSTSAVGPSTVTPFRPLNERITAPFEGRTPRPRSETASQAGMSHSKRCANCGGTGHLVANCITAEHGSIKVCVFCKTKEHLTDECQSFKKLDLAAKVKVLVTDRAGKPQLSTVRPWWRYLHDFLVSEDTKDLPVPTAFPWRLELADNIFKGMWSRSVGQLQREFDKTQDTSKLPKDGAMKSLEDVYSRHWKGKKLAWPARLGNMSADVDMRDVEDSRPNDPRPAAYYEDLSKYVPGEDCASFSDAEE
ncbi:hypothetical protein FPCIR_12915 [Fusarium pseudocircinatum]|uniref:CCHC-type domain-containing protein n=1 Tax=Fusarium pseudocircinatum TaxID=56676 RepID=A0A8H5KKC9_9HYPO|nr:hypothetical protein FPCIR_12915 [Fusarium pseudocircinatum]